MLRENLILINADYLKGKKNNSRTNLHITMRSYLKSLLNLPQETFLTHILLTTSKIIIIVYYFLPPSNLIPSMIP